MDSSSVTVVPKKKTRVIPATPLKILDAPSMLFDMYFFFHNLKVSMDGRSCG